MLDDPIAVVGESQGRASSAALLPDTSLLTVLMYREGTPETFNLMDVTSAVWGNGLDACFSQSAAFSSPFVRTIASRILLAFW